MNNLWRHLSIQGINIMNKQHWNLNDDNQEISSFLWTEGAENHTTHSPFWIAGQPELKLEVAHPSAFKAPTVQGWWYMLCLFYCFPFFLYIISSVRQYDSCLPLATHSSEFLPCKYDAIKLDVCTNKHVLWGLNLEWKTMCCVLGGLTFPASKSRH